MKNVPSVINLFLSSFPICVILYNVTFEYIKSSLLNIENAPP